MRAPWVLLAMTLCLRAQEPLSGEIDVRNRFVTGDRGDVYRSVVNLGEGPRLFDAGLRYAGKDRVDVSAHSWGGDPNSELRVDARRDKAYEFLLQYRTLAYFNNLPSYANPLLAQGMTASQRAIDLRRRQLDAELRLRPRARFTPFVGLLRTSGDGRGVTPFVGSGDEFAVPTRFGDGLTTVRGGVEWTERRWSATVEQGYTRYSDSQDLDSGANPGNRNDALTLNRLVERYRATGNGVYTRGVLQAHPWERLSFTGHFVYSRPKLDVTHQLDASGAFRDPNTLRMYNSLVEQSAADASQPRTSGSWSTEFRPFSRWRLRHNWFSDAFQISGASPTAALLPAIQSGRMRLNLRFDQTEEELSGDFGRMLTVRAGHRYIRSDADLPAAELVFAGVGQAARIRRHTALAGATLNLWKGRARVSADVEASPGGETYFRTGLQDYRKAAVQGRYRVTNTLQVSGSWRRLSNRNTGIDFRNQQLAVTAEWLPAKARRVTLVGTYARETVESSSQFLDPTFFRPDISLYSDRGHHGSAYSDFRLPGGAVLHAGGAFSWSEGTRPTKYYMPQSRVTIPVHGRWSGVAEWRWYSYDSLERFRGHLLTIGLQMRLRPAP